MRIIKPYGRSVTQKHERKSYRILYQTKTNTFCDLDTHTQQNTDIVIAQWISVLDKIIRKPTANKTATHAQRDVREAISKEMWCLLKNRLQEKEEVSEVVEKKWRAKVHPYDTKKDDSHDHQNTQNIKGRWFERFCGAIAPEDIDAKSLAVAIETHLYDQQKRQSSNSKDKRTGLIASRAQSITKNVLKAKKRDFVDWNDAYFTKSDVAEEIYKEIEAEAKKSNSKVFGKAALVIAARHLHSHYASIFAKDDGTVMTIQEAKAHPLFPTHHAIKQTYRLLFKQSKVTRENVTKRTPRNKDELRNLAYYKRGNQSVNHDIRLGKVLHYELMRRAKNNPDKAYKWHWNACVHEIEQSEFWLTEGQITIKQNEAFQRVWRTSIAFMARGLRSMINPDYDLQLGKNDILTIKKPNGQKFYTNFRTQFPLVYGSSASCLLAIDADDEACAALFTTMKDSLYNLRNRSFHPTNFVSFCKEIEKSGPEGCEKLSHFWKEQHNQRNQRMIDALEAVRSHYFFTSEQNEQFIAEIRKAAASTMPLPRFNRILARAENASLKNLGVTLPSPAKSRALEKDPALQCRYTLLKLLYERPFRSYISKLSKDKLEEYIKDSISRCTEDARNMNSAKEDEERELILARADRLISNEPFETMADFLDRLTAATATEMRVQKHYQSDAAQLQKQTKYIDDLKSDVLASAFHGWLKDHLFHWLVNLQAETIIPNIAKCDLTIFRETSQEVEGDDWQKRLFLLLFLMPATPANRLVNQFRKWVVVRGKSTATVSEEEKTNAEKDKRRAEKLIAVFDLYMDTHNSSQDGQNAIGQNDEILKQLFEDENDFTKIFPRTSNPQDIGYLPLRGLREMLRFGDVTLLAPIFRAVKITNMTVQNWQLQKGGIAEAQEKRAKLHEELSKAKFKKTDDIEDYKKLQNEVRTFRDLAHQCCLTNHVELHGLMIEVLGRLVDFSGLFERDLYFQTLALFYHKGVAFDVFECSRKLANGQIYEFYRKNKEKIDSDTWPARLCDKRLRKHRNDLAHFNMLSPNAALNLTTQINKARHLMAYDRKLKNAVSKSVIDLFYREGMTLDWQMIDNYDLDKATVDARKIKHLNNNQIKEALKGDAYLKMVAILMGREVKKPDQDSKRKTKGRNISKRVKNRRDRRKK